ncbi:MAG: DUF5666 domain-containing protein [Thermodesulfobacteriota bacterium]
MRKVAQYILAVTAAGTMAMLVGACGGGGGGAGTPVVANGDITALGSITVAGIKFEDTLANITADDTPKTAAFLQPGMMVKVSGARGDDVSGSAAEIEVENEVRGAVTAVGADSLTVLGQAVFVDGGTVFANAAGLGGIVAGDNVEVHGARDVTGDILATRVEKLNANPLGDELRGVVATKVGTTAGTFTIGGSALTFSFDNNTALPHGAFEVGETVEIHLTGTAATRVEREDVEDDKFKAGEGQEMQVEGFVSNFVATPGTFLVEGKPVETTQATRFEGGLVTDLVNDVKVEAEGHIRLADNTLLVDKIKFKDSVRIETNVEAVAANSLTVFGKTVQVTSKTKNAVLLGTLAPGNGVRIRGFMNQDNTSFTATELQSSNPVAADQHIFQGKVMSLTGSSMVLGKPLPGGLTVNVSGAGEFRDDDENLLSAPVFLGSLRPGVTVVKARGAFASGTLTANKAEIE